MLAVTAAVGPRPSTVPVAYDGAAMAGQTDRLVKNGSSRQALVPPLGLGIILISAWYFPFAMNGNLVGFLADDALYLLMADYYVPGATLDPVLSYVHRISHLSHGYPLLLGLLGGGSAQLDIAHLVQTVCLVAALGLTAVFGARLCEDVHAGPAVLALSALAPATLLFSAEFWSEYTYLMFAQGALLAALAAERTPRWWWVCALACGLAAATRGIGVVLIAALAVTLLARAPRRAWPALGLALLPLSLTEYFELGGGSDYLEVLTLRAAEPTVLFAGMADNAASLWAGWLNVFAVTPGHALEMVSAVVLAAAAVGMLVRLRSAALDAFYVGTYLGLVLVWPYPEVSYRLIYPLAPLLVVHAMVGLGALLREALPRYAARAVLLVPVSLLACALPDSGRMMWTYLMAEPPLPAARASRYWLAPTDAVAAARDVELKMAMRDFMRQAADAVPPGECIYALHPQAVMFYARRISFPAPLGAARGALPGCRYHLLLSERNFRDAYRRLWRPYEVVLTARTSEGVAGVLVRYPETR